MTLKTRLLLAASFAVLLILGLSEWIGYRLTAAFLSEHALLMQAQRHHAGLVASLQNGQNALLGRLLWLHIVHAALTVAVLVAVVKVLCDRIVLAPLDDLLRHINYMGRGSWKEAIPVHRNDEIGQLTKAFNALGEQLTLTVQQFAAASKLSAMALLGQTLVRKVMSVNELLRTTEQQVRVAQHDPESDGEPILAGLRVAIGILGGISARFEAEFDREFELHSAPPVYTHRDRLS